MTHGVNPPVQTVQATGQDARPHGVFADPYCTQLANRDDAMLALGDLRYCPICLGAFPVHFTGKAPGAADSPPART